MALIKKYVPDQKFVKSITKEIILDIQLDNIVKVFHFPIVD